MSKIFININKRIGIVQVHGTYAREITPTYEEETDTRMSWTLSPLKSIAIAQRSNVLYKGLLSSSTKRSVS